MVSTGSAASVHLALRVLTVASVRRGEAGWADLGVWDRVTRVHIS